MKKLTLSIEALKYYRKEASNFRNLEKDILELTAMANNSEKLGTVGEKQVYKFGCLIMLINERTSRIETLTWRNFSHHGYKMTKEQHKKLRDDFKSLGLSSTGNSIVANQEVV